LVDHAHPKQKVHNIASTLSPGIALELPSETCFQTAWQGTRTARRHAPKNADTAWRNHPHCQAPLCSRAYYFCSYRLASQSPPSDATPVLAQY